MNEDTSRNSWLENQFDDSEPWPGPERLASFGEFKNAFVQTGRQLGKNLKIVQGAFGPVIASVGTHLNEITQAYIEAAKTASNALEVPESNTEGKAPHWQAPHPKAHNFDRRGRKLY